MPFKIKDLLIDIQAAETAAEARRCMYPTYCAIPSKGCRPPSLPCPMLTCGFRSPCLMNSCRPVSPCPLGTVAGPGYEDWWTPIEHGEIGELTREDLGALKLRLEQALEGVKAKHAELEAGVVREPETHEEIEVLEGKLEGALKELRARKAKLAGPGK